MSHWLCDIEILLMWFVKEFWHQTITFLIFCIHSYIISKNTCLQRKFVILFVLIFNTERSVIKRFSQVCHKHSCSLNISLDKVVEVCEPSISSWPKDHYFKHFIFKMMLFTWLVVKEELCSWLNTFVQTIWHCCCKILSFYE